MSFNMVAFYPLCYIMLLNLGGELNESGVPIKPCCAYKAKLEITYML